MGQSRHFGRRPTTSGPPLETDIVRAGRHVSKVPQAEVKRHAITCATLNDIVQLLFDEFSDCRHGAFRCTGDFRK
jgi:hypothetical protein